jgi:hypothetical protein
MSFRAFLQRRWRTPSLSLVALLVGILLLFAAVVAYAATASLPLLRVDFTASSRRWA